MPAAAASSSWRRASRGAPELERRAPGDQPRVERLDAPAGRIERPDRPPRGGQRRLQARERGIERPPRAPSARVAVPSRADRSRPPPRLARRVAASDLHPCGSRRRRSRQGGPGRAALADEGGVGLLRVVAGGGGVAGQQFGLGGEQAGFGEVGAHAGRLQLGHRGQRRSRAPPTPAARTAGRRSGPSAAAPAGTSCARYSASTRSYQRQRGGNVAAAGGDPAEVVADLGRGERLADRLVQLLGAQEVGLGRGQRAAGAPAARRGCTAGAPPTARRPPGGTRVNGSPVALQRLVEPSRAAAGSSRAAPASARGRARRAPAARARPPPAPRAIVPRCVSAHERLIRASPARRASPPSSADRHRAPQVRDGRVGVAELDRGQPQRPLGGRRASRSAADESTDAASERAARASAEARRTASSACSSTVAIRVSLPQTPLPATRSIGEGVGHERTSRALGPPQGRRQPRQGERLPAAPRPDPGRPGRRAGRRKPSSPAGRRRSSATFGVTTFTRPPQNPEDPATRGARRDRAAAQGHRRPPAGPGRASRPTTCSWARAITLTGEPRIQGGPGSSVRQAKLPQDAAAAHDPRAATARASRSPCSTPACSSTSGSRAVQQAAGRRRRLGRRARRLRRQRVRPRHVHRRPDPAGRARGRGLRRQGARLARRRRRPRPSPQAMEQLPQDVDIVNLSLGGYTDDDSAPLAIACALQAMRKQRSVVVAAAGNNASRPPVLAGGVQAGARRRRRRAEGRRSGQAPTSATTAGGSTPPRAA